jgi:hypothetical protein
VTAGIEPKHKPAAAWSKDRRFREAAAKVLNEGWSQAKAAEFYGVSRNQLSVRMRKTRTEHELRMAQATAAIAARAGVGLDGVLNPLGIDERRRVPPPEDFDRMYFGHFICPDCGVRHDSPGFHSEIRSMLNDPTVRRGGINVPPYHAKTTVTSVRDTIRKLTMNPNYRRIIVSKSTKFAETINISISELLTNTQLYEGAERNLIEDWGPFRTGSEKWNNSEIYIHHRVTSEKDPNVFACGVGTQIYGRRCDDMVFDDIATLENQRNPERVVNMLEWIDKEALTRMGKSGGAYWVGTRVHPGDIYSVLAKRLGYRWIRYPLILDEDAELTLWPEHFPFEQALVHREEMSARDFALVMMNHEMPGLGASFSPEIVEPCFDPERTIGHHLPGWRLIGGVDPAGGGKGSGVTSFFLVGIDPRTGMRYIIDHHAVKSMKAPEIKSTMLDWSNQYPIYEWRVESNGVQSNLIQYNDDIIRPLANMGVKVSPHYTDGRKWDPQFGVESMAPLFSSNMISIPWANGPSRMKMQPYIEELYSFPLGATSDRVMSHWFAEIGCRDILRRASLPLFDSRTERWPNRIKRKRMVVDFANREVRRVPLSEQTMGRLMGTRRTVGRPAVHSVAVDVEMPPGTKYVNVGGQE